MKLEDEKAEAIKKYRGYKYLGEIILKKAKKDISTEEPANVISGLNALIQGSTFLQQAYLWYSEYAKMELRYLTDAHIDAGYDDN